MLNRCQSHFQKFEQNEQNLRPSNGLPQCLHTPQDTRVMAQIRQIRRVLPHQPVQKLLERLAAKLPKEHERIALPETALEPIEHGRLRHVVELLLQDRRPDPRARQDGHNCDESNLRALFDVNVLVIQQRCNDEGAEDARKVGEEAAERARAHRKVLGEPGADEAVVEVADEEGRQQQQDAPADEESAHGLELLGPGRRARGYDARAVFAPDFVCGREAEGDGEPEAHDYDEDDVGGGGDGAAGLAVRVEAKVDGTADDWGMLVIDAGRAVSLEYVDEREG
jgi:hypothetical protein